MPRLSLPRITECTLSAKLTIAFALLFVWASDGASAEGLRIQVLSVSPAASINDAPIDAAIEVHFDRPVNPASIVALQSFWAFGRWSGTVSGTFSFADDHRTVKLVPDEPLSAGETVLVFLSHDIQAADGTFLRDEGYHWRFWTNARPAALDFSEIQRRTTRTIANQSTRSYGGIGSDLNNDGFLDVTVVNEDTADLRVFLNAADRSGEVAAFTQPTFSVGDRASPNEPADFNRDGNIDICVANIDDDTISVLLGNGDGTFAPQQTINVGDAPRGIAAVDIDGDGDMDIVHTNSGGSGNLSKLINNGAGVFGSPTTFEGGGTGEWALAATDMNGDGIVDLVVAARTSQQMIVHLGNGDGTFTQSSSISSDGFSWMLVCGDVDGNGTEDVAVVNSTSNRAAILFGNGAGGLSAAVRYTTDPFCLAVDLGDMDGDGDLDLVTSSFQGDWWFFTNNGAGVFTFAEEFNATIAASCAVMLDFDNDGDLDLTLIDEEQDEIIMMKNSGTAAYLGDLNNDCIIDAADYAGFHSCASGPNACVAEGCRASFDFDDNCTVDLYDYRGFQNAFTGGAVLPNCTP